jgi:hypothetical protein
MLCQHEPRARVRRGEHAVHLGQQVVQAAVAAPQPLGALETLLARGRAHLRVDMRENGAGRVAARREQAERLVETPAIEVRVEVVETR